jgi:hypothetical protein
MRWLRKQKEGAKRRRWVPWVTLAASLVLVNLLWRAEGYRRWHRLIAEAKARGEPVEPENFDPGPEVPEGENAVASLLWAEEHVAGDKKFDDFLERIRGRFYPPRPVTPADFERHLDIVEPMFQANRPALESIRRARCKPRIRWDVQLRPPLWKAVSESKPWEVLGKSLSLLQLALLYDQATENNSELVEQLRDVLRVQEVTAAAPVGYYGYEEASDLNFDVISTVERAAPHLKIAIPSTAAPLHAATREQVSGLISDLLDEGPMRDSAARAFRCQRMVDLEWVSKGNGFAYPMSDIFGFGPVSWFEAVRVAQDDGIAAAAIKTPSWPAALTARPEEVRDRVSLLESMCRGGSRNRLSNDVAIRRFYWAITARRTAAVMLALRLWREEHNGQLPATLEALVPFYLPSIPVDPFAADGKAIRYKPHTKPPVVYSVNLNGTDDGGGLPTAGRSPWQSADAAFSLEGDVAPPPVTQPSTQAQDHH